MHFSCFSSGPKWKILIDFITTHLQHSLQQLWQQGHWRCSLNLCSHCAGSKNPIKSCLSKLVIPLSLYWSLRSRASYIIWFQDTSTRKSTDIHPSLIINHPTVLLVVVNKNHHFPTDFHQFPWVSGWCPSQNFPVPGAGEDAWKQPVCLWLFYFHIRKCEKNILPICCAKEFSTYIIYYDYAVQVWYLWNVYQQISKYK